ncbi:DNA-binding transcriptional regulator, MarR family [Octadecabacter temperatus]|uniref:MarR family protein n=1 Tax=Octadecabacter temperatus TaxID=1458307 RepID=A0A0K0Y6E2_9RHOB|nr:helix-turn-helix domain-containing protein [Octadecabacter temperatus]AKS46466.1 MarR family protein [Octadecabacter temperatus]SIO14584.1 DNA-binding transcriptional regulator, MarR family [Octadecabacter temperatus]
MIDTKQLYKLIWMSRPLMQSAEAAVERGLKGSGLTVRTRAVLEVLQADNEATVPDIAKKLEIKRQYVQLMVNETLAEGLTVKRANPRHKRSTLIALTQKGQTLIEDVVQREMKLVRSIGEGLNAADIETALRVVTTLTENLKTEFGSD